MIKLVHLFRDFEKKHANAAISLDKDNLYLNNLLDGSYAYHRIPELSIGDEIEIGLAITGNEFFDDVDSLTDAAINEISGLFGNVLGLYEERSGKLINMTKSEQNGITSKLNILDIVFEKTPFRLTDNFIPGHWGHVAIWVGGQADIPELKRLGVWQKLPEIEAKARIKHDYKGSSFQNMIKQDRGILEALRDDVQLNTFEHFLNIDDLAIIRNRQLTDAQKTKYLLGAFAQIGKEYDFNFDVETPNKIVCSELVFRVYDDFSWPVEETIGRYTVSPDHVAALAKDKKSPFQPILIYHDGKMLPESSLQANFNALLNGQYDKVVYKN